MNPLIFNGIFGVVKELIGLFPSEEKRAEVAAKIEEAQAELAKAQIAVNAEEAKSGNWFIAGWRPAAGWVCVLGLAYAFVIQPIIGTVAIDTATLMALLGGLLGLGGLRTSEKIRGIAK